MKERWKYIEGFNKWYSVSSYGRVRANSIIHRGKNRKKHKGVKKFITPKSNNTSARMHLYHPEGGRKMIILKNLVAEYFIPLWFEGCTVRLKEPKDKLNCSIYNIKIVEVDHQFNRKLTWPQVQEIRAEYLKDNSHGRKSELARKYNVSPWAITLIIRGERWGDKVKNKDRRRDVSQLSLRQGEIDKTDTKNVSVAGIGRKNSFCPNNFSNGNSGVAGSN